jgi:hypothetical protein
MPTKIKNAKSMAIDELEQNIRDSRNHLSYDAKIKIHNEMKSSNLKWMYSKSVMNSVGLI